MYLETGRDLFRGAMILISAALSYWVHDGHFPGNHR
jgi:hypothetical protein